MNPTATVEPRQDTSTDPAQTATVGGYEDGPIGRHERLADEKDAQADELIDAGDEEGAQIARIEANAEREKARELREGEGGEPTGEMQSEVATPEEIPPEEIIVAGIEMSYPSLGGKRPTGASLKLVGAKVKLAAGTGFKKGTRIQFTGVAVVNFVGQKDEHDATTQQVTDAIQRHEARVTDLIVEVPE